MLNKIAAPIPLFPPGSKLEGKGPLGLEGEASINSTITFNNFISTTTGILTLVAIIWFMYKLLLGGLAMLTSGGDKAKIAQARSNLFSGLAGLAIIVLALFLIAFLGEILGIEYILSPGYQILTIF